jgi:UDPglucose--hexose-1-phosphate uridylyltransferase
VPFAARWPVEVHIYPNRFVHNLVELDEGELNRFAQVYLNSWRQLSPSFYIV